MSSSPKFLIHSTSRGLGWSLFGILMTTLLQLIYTAVISRLLEPSDFGLMAAALLGLRFVTFLSRFGLGSAVVQRSELTDAEISSAHTLACLFGLISGLVVVVLSPVLGGLVHAAEAGLLMRWLALGVVASGVAAVPEALLRRQMRFRALSSCQIVSFCVGYLGVGVPMAVNGRGVTSLVTANIVQSMVYLGLTIWYSRTALRLTLDRLHVRRFVKFGGTVTVTGFMEFLQSNTDTVSVSRWIGPSGLGQYTRATYLVSLPVEQAVAATSRVLLPTFSSVQHDRARFSRGYLLSVGPLAALVMVPIAMVSVAAPSLVKVLLGPGWEIAASVLPIVGIANGIALLTNLPAIAAESLGEVTRKLWLQLVALVCTIGFVGLAVYSGPTLHRLAFAWMGGELARHVLYWVAMLPTLGVSRKHVAARYASAAFMAAVAAAPLWIVVRHLGKTGILSLGLAGAGGCIAAVAALRWLPLTRSIRTDLATLRSNALTPSPV